MMYEWFRFIGTKIIAAFKMTRGEYNIHRGWTIPEDEDPNDEGYIVRYDNSYISWSPKKAFEDTYHLADDLNFGLAVEACKMGMKIARRGWNGRGMFVVYQKGYPDGIPCNANTAEAWGLPVGDLFRVQPYLQIRNVDNTHSMWVPSINDVLAEDWYVVD